MNRFISIGCATMILVVAVQAQQTIRGTASVGGADATKVATNNGVAYSTTLRGTTTNEPPTYDLWQGLMKIPRPTYQSPYVADELYAFGLSETVNYNGTSNLVIYLVSYNLTPGGSRKDLTKPGWAWVLELNYQVVGQTNKIENYIRYVGTDGTDWRPEFKVFDWDSGLNNSVNGGLYLQNKAYTLFTTFNTDGGNAGRIFHNGSMEFAAFPVSGNRPNIYIADRGYITLDSTTEALSYAFTVHDNEKSLGILGNESGATNVIFTNFVSAPMIVSIPYGGLEIGPTPAVVTNMLTATATLDFPSTLASTNSDLAITVSGATTNDFPQVAVPSEAVPFGGNYTWRMSNNAVWIRFTNVRTNAASDPAVGVFRALVTKIR